MKNRLSPGRASLIGLTLLMACLAICSGMFLYSGLFCLNNILGRMGAFRISLITPYTTLPPWLYLALEQTPPLPLAGTFQWRGIQPGFEVTEMPVIARGVEVDRLFLTRIDPHLFRFEVLNDASGKSSLDSWVSSLSPTMVINASFYGHDGQPATPILSNGTLKGPRSYQGHHGAFVAGNENATLIELQKADWREVFKGSHNAFVSYPLLLAADGKSRIHADKLWLANRSFIAQDSQGHIVFGTTQHAFFSLDRFATFLKQAPLQLVLALNLDGGPVACQAINSQVYRRRFCGEWEVFSFHGFRVLKKGFETQHWPLPNVVAVFPKA